MATAGFAHCIFTPPESKSVKLTVKEGVRKQADLTVLKLQEGR